MDRPIVPTVQGIPVEMTNHKGQVNGYAGLNSNGHVPAAQLGGGTANASTMLCGDGQFRTPPGAAGGIDMATAVALAVAL